MLKLIKDHDNIGHLGRYYEVEVERKGEYMILISSCLVGKLVRYDGKVSESYEVLKQLVKEGKAIIACPEILGGLPVPRPSCEIKRDINGHKQVMDVLGIDTTEAFERGANKTLALCKKHGVELAVLKERSPSCGRHTIYNGVFNKTLIEGQGLTAELLLKAGIEVINESELHLLTLE